MLLSHDATTASLSPPDPPHPLSDAPPPLETVGGSATRLERARRPTCHCRTCTPTSPTCHCPTSPRTTSAAVARCASEVTCGGACESLTCPHATPAPPYMPLPQLSTTHKPPHSIPPSTPPLFSDTPPETARTADTDTGGFCFCFSTAVSAWQAVAWQAGAACASHSLCIP